MAAAFPDAAVVSYVNSSAEIKAESDICCTSSNAVDVVNSLNEKQVIFVPDRNLGHYVSRHSVKEIITSPCYCYVHENITVEQLKDVKRRHPEAEVIVHPECTAQVLECADFVGGTAQMSKYVSRSRKHEFVVGTENNFVWRLMQDYPKKSFYPVFMSCAGMARITPDSVRRSLDLMEYKITIDDNIRIRAKMALDKMLRVC